MITLQFCAFHSTSGALIQWFTHGPVGHVDAVMPDGTLLGAQSDKGLGGMPSGVYARPGTYGESSGMTNRIWISFQVTEEQEAAFYEFLRAQIGKPYDMRAIRAFATGQDWRTDDAWICSELIAAALEHISFFAHPLSAPVNRITPGDLLLLCSAFAPLQRL